LNFDTSLLPSDLLRTSFFLTKLGPGLNPIPAGVFRRGGDFPPGRFPFCFFPNLFSLLALRPALLPAFFSAVSEELFPARAGKGNPDYKSPPVTPKRKPVRRYFGWHPPFPVAEVRKFSCGGSLCTVVPKSLDLFSRTVDVATFLGLTFSSPSYASDSLFIPPIVAS